MGLLDDCEKLFKTKNLYEILAVERNATGAQLRKAYKKASLLCHPDKVVESKKEEATQKFQVLSKVHFTLSDVEKRAIYDETGYLEEENLFLPTNTSGDVWSNYFRTMFPKVTPQAIDNYMKKYTGSKEEIDDLVANYIKYEGDMDKISGAFIGYQLEEEERFRKVLNDLIHRKEITAFPKFVKETRAKKAARHRRQNKYKKEASEAEKMVQESLLDAMALRVEQRESQYSNLMSNLVMKYGSTKTTKRDRKRTQSPENIKFVNHDVSYLQFKKELCKSNTLYMPDSLTTILTNKAKERESKFIKLIDNLEEKYIKKARGHKNRKK